MPTLNQEFSRRLRETLAALADDPELDEEEEDEEA
jgi:hypothetical protein